ncbi:UNVERIFIED_CONTAM: hypothetical protein GTU68_013862 [Idotea baltica]|nr:hypothetical protein [Idotea baltica]
MLPDSLTSGSRIAVQCVLVQGDPPVELQWFHNHRLAHKTPGVTVTPLGQFVLALVIDKVAPIHAGNYTCRATSGRADSSDSHSSILRVHGKTQESFLP